MCIAYILQAMCNLRAWERIHSTNTPPAAIRQIAVLDPCSPITTDHWQNSTVTGAAFALPLSWLTDPFQDLMPGVRFHVTRESSKLTARQPQQIAVQLTSSTADVIAGFALMGADALGLPAGLAYESIRYGVEAYLGMAATQKLTFTHELERDSMAMRVEAHAKGQGRAQAGALQVLTARLFTHGDGSWFSWAVIGQPTVAQRLAALFPALGGGTESQAADQVHQEASHPDPGAERGQKSEPDQHGLTTAQVVGIAMGFSLVAAVLSFCALMTIRTGPRSAKPFGAPAYTNPLYAGQ